MTDRNQPRTTAPRELFCIFYLPATGTHPGDTDKWFEFGSSYTRYEDALAAIQAGLAGEWDSQGRHWMSARIEKRFSEAVVVPDGHDEKGPGVEH